MPTVAPSRPVSPAGSPQPPFESVPRGQLLSMRPPTMGDGATSFVDRTSPDPRRARWGGAVEAARSLEREHQTPRQYRDSILSEAGRFTDEQLAKLGPGAAAPSVDVPQAPAGESFGVWSDRNYPEFAGRWAPQHMIQSAYQQYTAEQSARREMYRLNLARYRTQMQAAEYTAKRDSRPSRTDLRRDFLRAGELGLGISKHERGPVATTREAMDTMLEREAYGKGGLSALQKRRRQVRPAAKKGTGDIIKRRFMELIDAGNAEGARKLVDTWQGRGGLDDMTVVRALAPAVRRIQEAVSMMGQEPSEDEREMVTLYRDAIRRLAAQRPQTGAGAADTNIPSAWSQLMGPRTPDTALPTAASSPRGGMGTVADMAGQPAQIRGGGQSTMDTDLAQRLKDAVQRGELSPQEADKFLAAIRYEP